MMKVLFFLDEMAGLFIESKLEDIFKEKIFTKISYKIEIIEEIIWDYKPEIFFVHCHSESRDFARIKVLTKTVSQKMPNCSVIVTYHPHVNDEYKETYLKGYSCDLILPEFFISTEAFNKIKNIYQKKQHTTL